MKTLKYKYTRVIQQHYGFAWEDVSEYDCNSQGITTEMSGTFTTSKNGVKREVSALTHDVKEYRLTGYPTRVIFRKQPNIY